MNNQFELFTRFKVDPVVADYKTAVPELMDALAAAGK